MQKRNDLAAGMDHITGNYYLCTTEIPAALGQMNVADKRYSHEAYANWTSENAESHQPEWLVVFCCIKKTGVAPLTLRHSA